MAHAEDAHRAGLELKKHAVLSDAKPECVREFPVQRLDIAVSRLCKLLDCANTRIANGRCILRTSNLALSSH